MDPIDAPVTPLPRQDIAAFIPSQRGVRAFEELQNNATSYGDAINALIVQGNALVAAPYVTFAADLTLTNEKILTQGAGLAFTSGGPDFTVSLAVSGVTAATYGSASQVSQITFDQYGRATSAVNVTITPAAIGALAVANNLSDVASASASRLNLGLGTVATLASDTDGALTANSDLRVATQKAVKTYIDNAVTGLLDFKGATDCSGNPNYPSASKGDAYVVNVAGKIGGGSGVAVEVGDVYVASADNAGGTQGAVGSSWFVLEHNLQGALLAGNNLSDLTSASTARTNLGLGSIATQNANNVTITGGAVTGITDIAIADGGTGASTASDARINLGIPTALFDHYTDAGNSTTTETDLYSDTIAAGQLGANGAKLEAEYGGLFVSSGTATRQIKYYFGGTAIFDTGALTLSLSSAWTMYVSIIRVSSSVIRYMISMTTEGAALAAYTAVGELTGLTLANAQVAKITGQAAGVGASSGDITAKLGTVAYYSAA